MACLLVALTGCTDEPAVPRHAQEQIQHLQQQNDSLEQRTQMLTDSIQALSNRLLAARDDARTFRKLQSVLLDNRVGVWNPGDQAMSIHFADSVDAQNVQDLVAAFNERFANDYSPELQLQSVEGAVARVGVSDDGQLGNRMGTGGSGMYLATMTYTLTSLPRIDSVYLDIEYDSHASPGYYSRATWLHLVPDE